jgi:hypothetical protein
MLSSENIDRDPLGDQLAVVNKITDGDNAVINYGDDFGIEQESNFSGSIISCILLYPYNLSL